MRDNQVLWYTTATVEIHFPEDKVCCELCPLLETYSRNMCRKTGEYIADTRGIGYMCPLKFKEDQNEEFSQTGSERDRVPDLGDT